MHELPLAGQAKAVRHGDATADLLSLELRLASPVPCETSHAKAVRHSVAKRRGGDPFSLKFWLASPADASLPQATAVGHSGAKRRRGRVQGAGTRVVEGVLDGSHA
jgi:hypothetical protein